MVLAWDRSEGGHWLNTTLGECARPAPLIELPAAALTLGPLCLCCFGACTQSVLLGTIGAWRVHFDQSPSTLPLGAFARSPRFEPALRRTQPDATSSAARRPHNNIQH